MAQFRDDDAEAQSDAGNSGAVPVTDKWAILNQRAALLALPREAGDPGKTITVVQFRVGGEDYGVEPRHAREVFRFNALTRVPGAPPFVLGIINVRGRVVSLVDLRVFFELPREGLHDRSRALILASAAMEFGVLVDAVSRTREVAVASIEASLPSLSGVRGKYVRGVTPDRVVILDCAALLGDSSLAVGVESGAPGGAGGSLRGSRMPHTT